MSKKPLNTTHGQFLRSSTQATSLTSTAESHNSEQRVTVARSQLQSLLLRHGSDAELSAALAEVLRLIPLHTDLIGTRVGAYEILELLGAGGMGEVYLAVKADRSGESVALKVIRPGMDSRQVVARFHFEQQVLEHLQHPNIAQFIESGISEEGRAYFVMEFIRGIPITDYCNHYRLTIRDRVQLLATACKAVSFASGKGVVHRDLKPTNVLVTEQRGEPVVKVIDFGLAKALSPDFEIAPAHSHVFQWVGTPHYMSPEQSAGAIDIDARADVYSLGVILFELLTGNTPLPSDDPMRLGPDEWRYRILEDDQPTPSERLSLLSDVQQTNICRYRSATTAELLQQIRGDLDAITRKSLEKDRSLRYASPQELATDLESYLGHRPIQACAPNLRTRIAKWARRKPQTVRRTSIGLLLLCAAIILAYAWHSVQWYRGAFEEAKHQQVQAQRADSYRSFRHDLHEALKYLRAGNINEVQSLVDRIDKLTVPESQNHFLLRYLKYQLIDANATITGTDAPILSMDVARRRNWVASGSRRGEVIVWDSSTGERLHSAQTGPYEIICICFSPDDAYMATSGQDSVIRIWDTTTWTQAYEIGPCDHSVRSVAWSPGGDFLAAGDFVGRLRIWNLKTREVEHEFQLPDEPLSSVAWSPDGKQIAVSCRFKGVYAVDTTTWKLLPPLVRHAKLVRSVDYSHDGQYLAVGDHDATEVRIYKSPGLALHGRIQLARGVQSVKFLGSRDLLAGKNDGTVDIIRHHYHGTRWTYDRTLNTSIGLFAIIAMRPSFDEDQLFVATSFDRSIQRFPMRSVLGFHTIRLPAEPVGIVPELSAVITVDERVKKSFVHPLSASDASGASDVVELPHNVSPHAQPRYCRKRNVVALASSDGTDHRLLLFDGETWSLTAQYVVPNPISHISLSPQGNYAVVSCFRDPVRLYDLDTGKFEEFPYGATRHGCLAIFSPTSNTIAMGAIGTELVEFIDAESRHKRGSLTTTNLWRHIAYSPDGAKVAIDEPGRITFWSTTAFSRDVLCCDKTDGPSLLRFSPDGKMLVSLAEDGTLVFWDSETRAKLYTTVTPQSQYPAIDFLGNNRLIVNAFERKAMLDYGSEAAVVFSSAGAGPNASGADGSSAFDFGANSGTLRSDSLDEGPEASAGVINR